MRSFTRWLRGAFSLSTVVGLATGIVGAAFFGIAAVLAGDHAPFRFAFLVAPVLAGIGFVGGLVFSICVSVLGSRLKARVLSPRLLGGIGFIIGALAFVVLPRPYPGTEGLVDLLLSSILGATVTGGMGALLGAAIARIARSASDAVLPDPEEKTLLNS